MQWLRFWATNLRVGGSNINPGLGLAVVTLSKSLYPIVPAYQAVKQLPGFGWSSKEGQNISSIARLLGEVQGQ